jgi:uncharacterized membrane protein YgcG
MVSMAIEMRKKKEPHPFESNPLLLKNRIAKAETEQAPTVQYNPTTAKSEPVAGGFYLPGESRYKTPPSNHDIQPNTNYMQDMLNSEKQGDFNTSAYFERMHNQKINDGYGGGYAPTNFYNYNSKYGDKISQLMSDFENYEDFRYDPADDESYQSLARVYRKNARDAATNAMAQVMAANGGRGGSNAVIASNLAYQNKMAGLEAEIPALRELAYNMYLGKKNDLRESLNDYIYQDQTDYGRWQSDLERRIDNEKYLYDRQNAEAQNTYNRKTTEEKELYNRALERTMQFGVVVSPEDAAILGVAVGTPISDSYIWKTTFDYNKALDERDYKRRVYEDERDFRYKQSNSSGGSGGSGGSNGGSGSGSDGNVFSDINPNATSDKPIDSYYQGETPARAAKAVYDAVQSGAISEDEAYELVMRKVFG